MKQIFTVIDRKCELKPHRMKNETKNKIFERKRKKGREIGEIDGKWLEIWNMNFQFHTLHNWTLRFDLHLHSRRV